MFTAEFGRKSAINLVKQNGSWHDYKWTKSWLSNHLHKDDSIHKIRNTLWDNKAYSLIVKARFTLISWKWLFLLQKLWSPTHHLLDFF